VPLSLCLCSETRPNWQLKSRRLLTAVVNANSVNRANRGSSQHFRHVHSLNFLRGYFDAAASWREPRIYGLNKRFLIGLCVWFLLVDFLECGRHFSSCPRFPLSGLKFRFLIARFEGFISHQNVAHAPPEKYTKISRYVAR